MDVDGFKKTYSLDQGEILGNDQVFQALYNAPLTDAKRQGICTGLSMIWLARRMMFHSESAEQRANALFTGAAFRWGGKTQDIHLKDGSGGGATTADLYDTWYGGALQAYALRIVKSTVVDNPWTGSMDAVYELVSETGVYALYNIGLQTNSGAAGHMVASYSSHGSLLGGKHFYFFDPNMGEYRISAKDTKSLLLGVADSYLNSFAGVNYFDAFEVTR